MLPLLLLLLAASSVDPVEAPAGEGPTPWSSPPPAIPGIQLWRQRVPQGHHGYRPDSLGFADYFLALLVGIPAPRPALLAFTAVRKYTDTDWDAKGIGLRTSWGR